MLLVCGFCSNSCCAALKRFFGCYFKLGEAVFPLQEKFLYLLVLCCLCVNATSDKMYILSAPENMILMKNELVIWFLDYFANRIIESLICLSWKRSIKI